MLNGFDPFSAPLVYASIELHRDNNDSHIRFAQLFGLNCLCGTASMFYH